MIIDKASLALAAVLIVFWIVPALWSYSSANPPKTRGAAVCNLIMWTLVFLAFITSVWGVLR